MTASAPLVTVVVPTYNRADHLGETIDSVLAQRYPAIEVVVVDDGSTDRTAEVLGAYGDRITVIRQPNSGQARAVNAGLARAAGEYITIVSDDDPLLEGALDTLVETLESELDALVAYPDWRLIDSEGNEVMHMPSGEYSLADMVRFHVCLPGPCALFRRRAVELTGGWDPRWRWVADYDFWMRVALHGPMVRVPQQLATWRRHAAGATTATPRLAMAREQIEVIAAFFARDDIPPEIRALEAEAMSTAYMVGALVAGADVRTPAGARFTVHDRLAQVLAKRVRRIGTSTGDTAGEIIQWQATTLAARDQQLAVMRAAVAARDGEVQALTNSIRALRVHIRTIGDGEEHDQAADDGDEPAAGGDGGDRHGDPRDGDGDGDGDGNVGDDGGGNVGDDDGGDG